MGVLLTSALFSACKRDSETSAAKAREHVKLLVSAATTDVEEIRKGLPRGAEYLQEYFSSGKLDDAAFARDALDRARSKVQDLRVAKSTFFALVDAGGIVLRSDQEHDALAGKSLFAGFPALRDALSGKYVEARGEIAEASAVRGRHDAQWAAAHPVSVHGSVRGVYATGWSWSAYAYRLENQLRSQIRGALAEREKEPLVYVYVVVEKDVFGAPISPDVNARAVRDSGLTRRAAPGAVENTELEITGREFGLAYQATPALGTGVGIAVLRTET